MPITALGIYVVQLISFSGRTSGKVPHIQLNIVSIGNELGHELSSMKSIFTFVNIYSLGVFIFFIYSLFKIFKVLSKFKGAEYLRTHKVWLMTSAKPHSYSFLNRIHLSNSLEPADRNMVLEHELLHVKLQHSRDLILLEIFHALMWFNPFLFILKKELICVHENQVDQEMYSKHNRAYLRFLVAATMGVNSTQILLTSQFNNGLSLTQRVKQMKSKTRNNWAVLSLIPALAISLVFVSFTSKGTVLPMAEHIEQDSIYDNLEQAPEFPGGEAAMQQFIAKNIIYPDKALTAGIEGIVYCQFVVRQDGRLTDIESLKSPHKLLSEETERVIAAMPKWIPGQLEGKNVSVRYVLPLNFKIPE
jgi:TonB family protein